MRTPIAYKQIRLGSYVSFYEKSFVLLIMSIKTDAVSAIYHCLFFPLTLFLSPLFIKTPQVSRPRFSLTFFSTCHSQPSVLLPLILLDNCLSQERHWDREVWKRQTGKSDLQSRHYPELRCSSRPASGAPLCTQPSLPAVGSLRVFCS